MDWMWPTQVGACSHASIENEGESLTWKGIKRLKSCVDLQGELKRLRKTSKSGTFYHACVCLSPLKVMIIRLIVALAGLANTWCYSTMHRSLQVSF